jgi:hypothetical protein
VSIGRLVTTARGVGVGTGLLVEVGVGIITRVEVGVGIGLSFGSGNRSGVALGTPSSGRGPSDSDVATINRAGFAVGSSKRPFSPVFSKAAIASVRTKVQKSNKPLKLRHTNIVSEANKTMGSNFLKTGCLRDSWPLI